MSHAVHYATDSSAIHAGSFESCETCRAAQMRRARESAKAYASTASRMRSDEAETVRRVNALLAPRKEPAAWAWLLLYLLTAGGIWLLACYGTFRLITDYFLV